MIVSKPIQIKIWAQNIVHYRNIGYKVSGGDIITIDSTELVPGSSVIVTRVCDCCGEAKELKFRKAILATVLCKRCATVKANIDRKDDSLTTCECGRPKAYNSTMCIDCYDKKDKSGENSASWGVSNPALAERNKNRKPDEHWNWKGGVSKRSGEQIKWAKDVKELAKNLCDCCGYSRGFALEAHHLHSDNTDKGEFTMDNGVSLCSNCHKEFHKKYGYGDNAPEQYIEFKGEYHE